MPDHPLLFLSYASDDRQLVPHVVSILDGLGFDCWWDQRLRVGQDFHDDIQHAMTAAQGIVALLSPAYVRAKSYSLREFRYARFTLERSDIALVLLEHFSPRDADISMTELKLPGAVLGDLPPEMQPASIASALAMVGIRLPRGVSAPTGAAVDEEGSLIHSYGRILAESDSERRAALVRLQNILRANPSSAYHCMNAALRWLHAGNSAAAAEHARLALDSRPGDGTIVYFAALVAAAVEPLARGPRNRIEAIWQLAEKAMYLGYQGPEPSILMSALTLEYFERSGIRPPPIGGFRHPAHHSGDRGELTRLLDILRVTAPAFCAVLERN